MEKPSAPFFGIRPDSDVQGVRGVRQQQEARRCVRPVGPYEDRVVVAEREGDGPFELPVGRYRLRVAGAGHVTSDRLITVTEDTEQAVSVELTPIGERTALLLLTSGEEPAIVTLDGRPVGRTPLRLPGVGPGEHAVEVGRDLRGRLESAWEVFRREPIAAVVRKRENSMSTGIGFGIGIPHASTELIGEVVAAFGRSRSGIDFDALDDQPVTLVVLFLVPQGQFQPHLRTLADIAKLLHRKEFRQALEEAPDAAAMADVIRKGSAEH